MNKNDTISKEYLLAEIDDLADEFSETDENGLHNERWCGISDAKRVIINTPFVSDRPQGWIPCSERLPEPGSWAIWCSIKGIIQVARWKEDAIDHFFPDQGFFNLEDAVAWMPLPEPWKGADDEVC